MGKAEEFRRKLREQRKMPAGLEKAYLTMVWHAKRCCLSNDDMARMRRESVNKRCKDYQDAKHDEEYHRYQLNGMGMALELAGLTECGGELCVKALKEAREIIRDVMGE